MNQSSCAPHPTHRAPTSTPPAMGAFSPRRRLARALAGLGAGALLLAGTACQEEDAVGEGPALERASAFCSVERDDCPAPVEPPYTPKANLVPVFFNLPFPCVYNAAAQQYFVSFAIDNVGDAAAPASFVRYSPAVTDLYVPALAPGQRSPTITVPVYFSGGDANLSLRADFYGQVGESVEGDNVAYSSCLG